jgi:hypothetical protein
MEGLRVPVMLKFADQLRSIWTLYVVDRKAWLEKLANAPARSTKLMFKKLNSI